MKNRFRQNLLNRGFTQAELLVVVLLVGVIPTLITSIVVIYYRSTIKLSMNGSTSAIERLIQPESAR